MFTFANSENVVAPSASANNNRAPLRAKKLRHNKNNLNTQVKFSNLRFTEVNYMVPCSEHTHSHSSSLAPVLRQG